MEDRTDLSLLAEVSVLEKRGRPQSRSLSVLLLLGNQYQLITYKVLSLAVGIGISVHMLLLMCKGASDKVGNGPAGSQTVMLPNEHTQCPTKPLCDFIGNQTEIRPLCNHNKMS